MLPQRSTGTSVQEGAADPRAQVITAAGAGSAAAMALNTDLVLEDVERALKQGEREGGASSGAGEPGAAARSTHT